MIPENSGQTWGSIYPRADLRSVGTEVCDQVAAMQKAAQQQYGVLLTVRPRIGLHSRGARGRGMAGSWQRPLPPGPASARACTRAPTRRRRRPPAADHLHDGL